MTLNLYNLLNQSTIPHTGVWKLLGVNGCSPSVTNGISGVSYTDSTSNFVNYITIPSTNTQLGNTYNPLVDVTTSTNVTNLYFSYLPTGCYTPVYLCINVNDKPDFVFNPAFNSCTQVTSVDIVISKTNPNIPNYSGVLNANASNTYSGVTTNLINNQTVPIPSTQTVNLNNLGAGGNTIYATLGANGCLVNKSFQVFKKSSIGQRFWFHNIYTTFSDDYTVNPYRFKLKGVTIKLKGATEVYYPNNNYSAASSNFGTSSYYNPPYNLNSTLELYRFITDRSNWLSNEIYTKTTVTSQPNFTFKPTTTTQGVVNQTLTYNNNIPLHAHLSNKFYTGNYAVPGQIVSTSTTSTSLSTIKFYVDVGDEVEWFIIDIVNFEYDPTLDTSELGILRLGSENTTLYDYRGLMENYNNNPAPTTWRVYNGSSFPVGTNITPPIVPFIQYDESLIDSNNYFAPLFFNNLGEVYGYSLNEKLYKPFKETITGLC